MEDMNAIQAIRAAFQPVQIDPAIMAQKTAPTADPQAIQAFTEVMESQSIRPENQVMPEPPISQIPFADRVGEAFKLAEAGQFATYEKLHDFAKASDLKTMSLAELMEMQYQVANLAFQQELVAKVVDRSSQAIQTLFKNQ